MDIFACGVILFIMYTGNPPFQRALVSDPFYKTIKDKQHDIFWDAQAKHKPFGFFTAEFKDLFVRMVAYKSEDRIKMEEILMHPYCSKAVPTHEQFLSEMNERKLTV